MFWPLVDDINYQCSCKTDSSILAWHSVAHAIEPSLSKKAQSEDGIRSEEGTDAFLEEELAIALALTLVWESSSELAKIKLLKAVSNGYSPHQFEASLEEASTEMSDIYDQVNPEVSKAVRRSAVAGALAAGSNQETLYQAPSVRLTQEAILKSTKYYTNKYFKEQIVPAIRTSIDKPLQVQRLPLF
jgi:hypothetical protein